MTYQITVTGLSASTTEQQLGEFLAFCGKVDSVKLDGTTAYVEFDKPAAVKTALLLTDSELNGSKIAISADESTIRAAEEDSNNGGTDSPNDGTKDIGQEYKPRATILAEYLSHGYVLGDKVIARGLDLDQKHGISSRFTKFLTDLDEKYHVRDKAAATDNAYGITDKAKQGHEHFNRYFDKALNTKTGLTLHSYYTELVKNAQDVHTEARRLANLKNPPPPQQQQPPQTSGEVPPPPPPPSGDEKIQTSQ